MKLILGVDPGMSGAVVMLRDGEMQPWLLHQDYIMTAGKAKTYDAAAMAAALRARPWSYRRVDQPMIVLEDVQGRAGWSASTAVSLAKCHGMYVGWASAWGWELVVVQASTWHRALRLGKPSGKVTAKQLALQYVSQRLPGFDPRMAGRFKKPHDGLVDAACLAAYGAAAVLIEDSLLSR